MSEEWRPIPGWPYEASSLGRIRRAAKGASTHPGRVLKTNGRHNGPGSYRSVRLSRGSRESVRSFCVHQLVAAAFMGEAPPGMVVNHIDCDKENDRPENLEYVTQGENVRHARENGRAPEPLYGEEAHSSKLTNEAVRVIRSTPRKYGSITRLARRFGVDRSAIYRVLNGESWTHI